MLAINTTETVREGSIFGQITTMDHEQLVICHDEATGLKALIGIHNTVLGPALGGTRMWPYSTEEEAIKDVLRLSRGMTFKNSLAGLNLGGGKAVIIGDPRLKSEAFLRRFGRFVESLGGRYVTAEDMNMKTSDMEYMALETRHVTGLPKSKGGAGDPSPVTAFGVYMGMKAAAKKIALSFDIDYKNPVLVKGDKERLQQVVSNLVVNSIKYGDINGTTEVSVENLIKNKVIVRITDNGEGIEKKHIPRLFERFYRVDKSGSRKEGGSGLGLSIVKHIIEAHDEKIYVESEFGVGSEFSFTLEKSK